MKKPGTNGASANKPGMRTRANIAVMALSMILIAGAGEAQTTIDAEQFCNRTGRLRDAIVEAISGATLTCTDADPDATPAVTALYETNITESQLAGITWLDMRRRWPSEPHPLGANFKTDDFKGLSGVRALWIYDHSPWRRRHGLAAIGVPIDFLGQLTELVFSNCDVNTSSRWTSSRGCPTSRTSTSRPTTWPTSCRGTRTVRKERESE